MDKEALKTKLKLLQRPKNPDNEDYMKDYNDTLDFVLDKVLNDVSLYTHIEIKELPDSIFQTIIMMASNLIDSFGLINDEEINKDEGIKQISEGDTSVTYIDRGTRVQQALEASSIERNFRRALNTIRRLL